MKKLLTLLGVVSIAASSAGAVVSCTASVQNNFIQDQYFNNSLPNILNATQERVKSIILDNEYGISQSITNNQLYTKLASDQLPDLDKNDFGDSNGTVGELVQKYYGNKTYTSDNTKTGAHVVIGNSNGTESGLDTLINSIFKSSPTISNFLIENKSVLESLLKLSQNSISMQPIENILDNMQASAAGGTDYPINTALQFGINYLNNNLPDIANKIAPIINSIANGKDKIANETLPGIFNTSKGIVGTIRSFMDDVFNNSTLTKTIYESGTISLPDFSDHSKTITTDLSKLSKIGSISLENVKEEVLTSIDDILSSFIDFSKAPLPGSDNTDKLAPFEYHLSFIINTLINKQTLPTKSGITSQQTIQDAIIKGLRIVAIISAQFNVYENTREYSPTSSTELFDFNSVDFIDSNGNKRKPTTNFEYLNTFVGKTLGDSQMVKDEAINPAYFLSMLDYYVGSLKNKDDVSGYRIQQFLFLLLNDPTESISNPGKPAPDLGDYGNKNSVLLDFITNTAVDTAKQYLTNNGSSNSTFAKIAQVLNSLEPSDIEGLENIVLKPLILGLSNGDNFEHVYQAVNGGIEGALIQFGDKLKPFKTVLDPIVKILKRALSDPKFQKETVHMLISGDVRPYLEGTNLIPEEWITKLFADNPINLTTLADLPLHNIFSLLNVKGFIGGMISNWGDIYTLKNIPQLIGTLNQLINGVDINNDVPVKYETTTDGKDVSEDLSNVDWTKSLKTQNIDFQAIYDLFMAFIGKDTAKTANSADSNIISRLLNDSIKIGSSSPNNASSKAFVKNGTLNIPGQMFEKLDDSQNLKIPNIQVDLASLTKDLGITGRDSTTGKATYSKTGISGSLFRIALPIIDLSNKGNTPDSFVVNDEYYDVDMLRHLYSNLVNILLNLDTSGDYVGYVYQLLKNDKLFKFDFDPTSLKYFQEQQGLVKSFIFKTSFLNQTTGKTNTYTFRISRNSDIDAFNIDSITTTKLD